MTELEQLREDAAQAMSETAPTWGHRFVRLLGLLGLDFGDADSTDWAMLRAHHRIIRWDQEALKAANEDKDWPPLSHPCVSATQLQQAHQAFRIELPDHTFAEVRHVPDPKHRHWKHDQAPPYEVWVIDEDSEYCSASVSSFEDAVRNIMGPVWEAALPF